MVILIIMALLAAVDVLPKAFFSPTVIALLVAFPVLIVLEGLVAPIELLSTLGNILSYARIMALGVASVMLAVVANRMVGAIGSVACRHPVRTAVPSRQFRDRGCSPRPFTRCVSTTWSSSASSTAPAACDTSRSDTGRA